MNRSFNKVKIVEALKLFGVHANAKDAAKAIREQLVQLIIQDQGQGGVVGAGDDGASVVSSVAPSAAGSSSGSKSSDPDIDMPDFSDACEPKPTVAAVMERSFNLAKIGGSAAVWRPRQREGPRQGAQGAAGPAQHPGPGAGRRDRC